MSLRPTDTQKKPDQTNKKTNKENDHALDALRYALYMTEPARQEIQDPYLENMELTTKKTSYIEDKR
jgi:hypothetical protein